MDVFEEDIRNALDALRKGGLILYPTDTIWGIGCDATDESAVQKAYALKKRADNKAMLVLIDSSAKLETYVQDVPETAWSLTDVAVNPLTIIYPKAKNLAKNLVGEDGSVGIRITDERFSKKLCERFRKPIVSTSANISGEPSPALFKDISDEIKNGVDYIVKYRRGETSGSKPSSVIKINADNTLQVIRK